VSDVLFVPSLWGLLWSQIGKDNIWRRYYVNSTTHDRGMRGPKVDRGKGQSYCRSRTLGTASLQCLSLKLHYSIKLKDWDLLYSSIAVSWRMTRNDLEDGRATSFETHSLYRHSDVELYFSKLASYTISTSFKSFNCLLLIVFNNHDSISLSVAVDLNKRLFSIEKFQSIKSMRYNLQA
jgi:hypothetical protein